MVSERGDLGAGDLLGNLAIVLKVMREVYHGHTTGAEFAIDGLAASQGVGETGRWVGHRFASSTARFIWSTQFGITRRYVTGLRSGARTYTKPPSEVRV